MVRKHHGDSDHERNDIFHQASRGAFGILLKCRQLEIRRCPSAS